MFGQEPRLPIDFLLGTMQEPTAGTVHDWVREHQTRLQMAFEGARGRLQAAAAKRKETHDRQVHDAPLGEGQLVHLRDCSVRGRHKIQDLWSPVVYEVVKPPPAGGGVYTIAPVTDHSNVKHVHRSLLKARLGDNSVVCPTQTGRLVTDTIALEEAETDLSRHHPLQRDQ